MKYANLGNTGTKVSRICLGCMTYGSKKWRDWVLEEGESRPFFQKAWEAGINFFDTADVYSLGESERVLGRALKEMSVPRERVVIATKVHGVMSDDVNDRGQSRKHIKHGVENSLKRLGTDYIDLYQIHRYDANTPMEETLLALGELVKEGKVLYLGASSMYAWQMAKMLFLADRLGVPRFVTMQNHYNLIYREEEREMNPLCVAEGVGLIPWSPLARGFLTGNRGQKAGEGETARAKSDDFAHKMYYQPGDYEVVDRLTAIAKAKGVSNAQAALAWMLGKAGVVAPIIGASKMYQLEDAIGAVEVTLTEEEVKRLEEPYKPHAVLGHS